MNFWKENWITVLLVAFVMLLPWQTRLIYDFVELQGAVSEYGILSIYGSEVVLILGLILGYSVFGPPQLRKENTRPALIALGLLGFVLLATIFSFSSAISLASFLHLGAAMLFFTAILDERTNVRRVIFAFPLSLIIPAILGLWQVIEGGSPSSSLFGLAAREAERLGDSVVVLANGTRVLRSYGSFPHPNMFGGYLAVGVVAVLWFLTQLHSSPNYDRKRLAIFGLFVLLFGTLMLTGSRSAMLGLALGLSLALLVLRAKNVKRARIAVIPIATVVIGAALLGTIFAPNVLAELRGGGELEVRSLTERAEQYREYPNVMSSKDWFIGNGLGTYVFAHAEVYPTRSVWEYQPIHNALLLIIAEIGLIGVAIVIFWSSTIDQMNFARFPNPDAVTAFAMGNVVLVILFFDHYLWSSWSGLALIAFVMALTVRMGESRLN